MQQFVLFFISINWLQTKYKVAAVITNLNSTEFSQRVLIKVNVILRWNVRSPCVFTHAKRQGHIN